jgi:hypothetical protein
VLLLLTTDALAEGFYLGSSDVQGQSSSDVQGQIAKASIMAYFGR